MQEANIFKKTSTDDDGNLVLSDLKYSFTIWNHDKGPKLMLQVMFPRIAVFGKSFHSKSTGGNIGPYSLKVGNGSDPGLSKKLELCNLVSDGYGLYATFFNTARTIKTYNGYADTNYRSLIVDNERLLFSDLTKARRVGGGMRNACGTPGDQGCFRGKFKLLYFLKHYGRRGKVALDDLLLNHVLFFADPGIIKGN